MIEWFVKKKTSKPKLVVIYWPTGSGKTAMSIDIAKQLDTEIISTDSRQIFKYMDIGTWKITPEETEWVVHHMIDIIEPNKEYSVGQFQEEWQKIIDKLHSEGKIPMLVWGTGLYIDSLIYNWDFPTAPTDSEVRVEIELMSPDEVYNELEKVDPEVAKEIHPNNVRRVQRALEIYRLTGKSKKEFAHEKELKYDVLFLTPYQGDREELYDRINRRVEKMVDEWLVEEIEWLFAKGYTQNDFWMNSIGYQEFFPYLRNGITLDEAIAEVQQNSRNYAKRQLTWFRKYRN